MQTTMISSNIVQFQRFLQWWMITITTFSYDENKDTIFSNNYCHGNNNNDDLNKDITIKEMQNLNPSQHSQS